MFVNSLAEKKIRQLEKDLFFYKTKFRQNKELLKSSDQTSTTEESNGEHLAASNNHSTTNHHSTSNRRSGEGVTFPPLSNPGRMMESERWLTGSGGLLDSRQIEESKRIQVSVWDHQRNTTFRRR